MFLAAVSNGVRRQQIRRYTLWLLKSSVSLRKISMSPKSKVKSAEGSAAEVSPTKVKCIFFKTAKGCKNGDDCKFLHEITETTTAATSSSIGGHIKTCDQLTNPIATPPRDVRRNFITNSISIREFLQLVQGVSEEDVDAWSEYLTKELYTDVGRLRAALKNSKEWDRIQLPLYLKFQMERLLQEDSPATDMQPSEGLFGFADLSFIFPTANELVAFQQTLKTSAKLQKSRAGLTRIPVALLRWTQDTINQHVRFGATTAGKRALEDQMICIWQTLDELFHGSLRPQQLPLRVVLHDSKLWCLDNRRLTVLKMYQATKQHEIIWVPCKVCTLDQDEKIRKEFESKKSTEHDGLTIRPGGSKLTKTLHLGADAFNQAEQAYMGMKRVGELEGFLNLDALRDKIHSKLPLVETKRNQKAKRQQTTAKSARRVVASTTAQAAQASTDLVADISSDSDYSLIWDDVSSDDEHFNTLQSTGGSEQTLAKDFLLMYSHTCLNSVVIPEELRHLHIMTIETEKAEATESTVDPSLTLEATDVVASSELDRDAQAAPKASKPVRLRNMVALASKAGSISSEESR